MKIKGKLILNELKRLYSNPYHKKLEELFHYLYHGGNPIKAIGKTENLVHCWLKTRPNVQTIEVCRHAQLWLEINISMSC